MKNLTLTNQTLTLSSVEIATLTETRHDNVKRTIKTLIDKGLLHHTQIEDGEKSANKVVEKIYNSDKRDSLVIVAKLSPEFMTAIIDRWQELESQQSKIPTSFAEALRLAANQAELIEQQALKLTQQKPKVEYFNNLVERNLLTNMRDTAKELHIKQNIFVAWLLEIGYVYRDKREQLKPYAEHTPTIFELKEYVNPHNGITGTQLLVTPKGRETFNLLLKINPLT